MNKYISAIISLFFPKYCVLCGKIGSLLCLDCKNNKFDYLALPYCPKCNGRLRNSKTIHKLCSKSSYLDATISILKFEKNIKKVLWAYKYHSCYQLATDLNSLIEQRLSTVEWKIDFIVPLPSTQRKIQQRGYDHIALLIARSKLQKWQGLIKNKNNKSQARLNRQQRFLNSLGTFSVINEDQILGKNLLLIDDVITTGYTLQSAAQVLKQAGAKAVYSLTLAKDVRDFIARGVEYTVK